MPLRLPASLVLTMLSVGLAPAAFGQSANSGNRSELQNSLPRAQTQATRSSSKIDGPVRSQGELDQLAVHPAAFRIAGVKSVPFNEVAAVFQPLRNTDTTAGALMEAARKISEVYARHGYALSYAYIPVQDLGSGSVQVVVVEGYVASLSVQGAPANLEQRIRSLGTQILKERPLRKATFERYVTLVSRLPGVSVDANVPTPANTDGATELRLAIRHQKVAFTGAFDANHPGFEGILTATVNGLSPLGDLLSASVMWPRGRFDKSYSALEYAVPVGDRGAQFHLNAYQYDGKDAGFSFNGFPLQKNYRDNRVGASISYPALLTADTSVIVEGGVYRSASGETFMDSATAERLDLRANVRALQLSANANWQSATYNGEASAQLIKGSNGHGARQLEDLVDLDFAKLRLYARRSDDWARGSIASSVSATVQASGSRLPSSEKVSFGGNYYAAAYPTGDAVGDTGWAAAAEISRPNYWKGDVLGTLSPYAGIDVQRVRSKNEYSNRGTLSSGTLGTRLAVNDSLRLALSVAKPLGAAPVGKGDRPWRFNLQGETRF